MIIDSHVHVLPEYRLSSLAKWMKTSFPGHQMPDNPSPADLVQDLKKSGITHFFNLVYPIRPDETIELNRFNAEFCSETPGAIPFAGIHPETPDKAKVADALLKDNQFAGFKIHSFVQRFDPWDERMDPFYAFMEEAQKPVIFHTGFEEFYQRPMPVERLRRLLVKYPKLPAVFVHMAFPWIEEAFALMDVYPNLYLDATGVFVYLRKSFQPFLPDHLAGERFARVLRTGLENQKGRVMFGSDHPVGWGDMEKVYKDLSFVDLSDELVESLTYGSAKSFIDRFMPGFDWERNLQSTEAGQVISR